MTFLMKSYVIIFLLNFSAHAATSACGKTVSYLFKIDPKGNSTLVDPLSTKDEFCDEGRNEYNANYRIEILDKNKKMIYHKNIFMNTTTISEGISPKKDGTFKSTKIEFLGATRIVKFPNNEQMTSARFYKVRNLKTKEEQISEIIWPVE